MTMRLTDRQCSISLKHLRKFGYPLPTFEDVRKAADDIADGKDISGNVIAEILKQDWMSEIEWCECYSEGKSDYTPQCGCPDPECYVRTYRDEIMHYDGQHWAPLCLARHLEAQLRHHQRTES